MFYNRYLIKPNIEDTIRILAISLFSLLIAMFLFQGESLAYQINQKPKRQELPMTNRQKMDWNNNKEKNDFSDKPDKQGMSKNALSNLQSIDTLFSHAKIISTNANSATNVKTSDLNNDGKQDVISASRNDNKIAWYLNKGNGSFGEQQVISTNVDGLWDLSVADLDGDGNEDVLSASYDDNKIAWYRNNGDGSFSEQKIISTSASGASSVYAADLDGDGKQDVLSASWWDDKIAWYRNLGDGSFSEQIVISTNNSRPESVHAADLNSDGNIDVLSASRNGENIAWYRNQGDGSFSNQQIISNNEDFTYEVHAADVNDDGHVDVLSASDSDDENITWYRNQGDGSFSNQQIISKNASGARDVQVGDMNSDGRLDILSAAGNKITWYRNLGNNTFGKQLIISDNAAGANDVQISDLDGDGRLDVLSASMSDNKIAWYENQLEEIRIITRKDSLSMTEDHTGQLAILNNDLIPYSDVTELGLVDSTHQGIAEIRNDTLQYEPNANFYGSDSLSYAAKDTANSDTVWVHINVTPVEDPPTVVDDTVEIMRGKTTVLDPLANDSDVEDRTLYLAATTNGNHGTAEISFDRQHIIYSPINDYTGTDRLAYMVTDSAYGEPVEGIIHIEVVQQIAENRSPTLMLPPQVSALEDSTLILPLAKLVSDDRDSLAALSYELENVGPTGASLDESNGVFTIVPDANWWGQQTIHLSVEDSDKASATDSMVVTVIPVNDPPQAEAAIASQSQVEGGYEVAFADRSADPRDPEDGIAKWSWSFGDGAGSSESSPTHVYSSEGTYTAELVVTDNAEATDTTTIEVDVTLTDIEGSNIPDEFALESNYPNPFNPSTKLGYDLPEQAEVSLKVYNTAGKQVATLVNTTKPAGSYSVTFNAGNLPSGVYMYRLETNSFTQTKKMILVK